MKETILKLSTLPLAGIMNDDFWLFIFSYFLSLIYILTIIFLSPHTPLFSFQNSVGRCVNPDTGANILTDKAMTSLGIHGNRIVNLDLSWNDLTPESVEALVRGLLDIKGDCSFFFFHIYFLNSVIKNYYF